MNYILDFFKNIPEIWSGVLEKIGPSLQIMWKGMLGIFVVMIIISVIVSVFTKISKRR